ncbi:MAG: CDP-glucose 4,6-dehydratase [Gracilibacteraceae bacterium]|jgi:CDP-glucose 4,6-dehydratase|nr:CDP-glucose 4,6-dehydratase [Gracilibacteraceae bacterium]
MENMAVTDEVLSFYKGRRVFITGHTGFKGTWLTRILRGAGAVLKGYALAPPAGELSLFRLVPPAEDLISVVGDIRDFALLQREFAEFEPEIVFHLAAQPLVRQSYLSPRETYETNVMGTVNLLECCRRAKTARSVLNVTTDKVYENKEWCWGYREDETLNGYDPYSNSKSCSELATQTYARSFLTERGVAVSAARAGNVIGGGDFAAERIIPDCVRAAIKGEPILLRYPGSTRPYQHVLEPLFAYLLIAARQYEDPVYAGCYNVGPDEADCYKTGDLADLFCRFWAGARWERQDPAAAEGHEAGFLKLDCSKLKAVMGWRPRWDIETAVAKTAEWYQAWHDGGDLGACMDEQIAAYRSVL